MAKQGQHKNDGNDPDVSRGHNNPRKSTPITTGSPKKQATYQRQAREHRDTDPLPQDMRNEWHEQTPRKLAASDGPVPRHPMSSPSERADGRMSGLDGIGRSLSDYKDAHRRLQGLSDDDLKRIVVVPEGDRLHAGAIYLDLEDDNAQPFTARGDEVAGANDLFIPKRDVDYVLWNRLTGVDTPHRLDQSDDGATPS